VTLQRLKEDQNLRNRFSGLNFRSVDHSKEHSSRKATGGNCNLKMSVDKDSSLTPRKKAPNFMKKNLEAVRKDNLEKQKDSKAITKDRSIQPAQAMSKASRQREAYQPASGKHKNLAIGPSRHRNKENKTKELPNLPANYNLLDFFDSTSPHHPSYWSNIDICRGGQTLGMGNKGPKVNVSNGNSKVDGVRDGVEVGDYESGLLEGLGKVDLGEPLMDINMFEEEGELGGALDYEKFY
jgi:hypothetical protein